MTTKEKTQAGERVSLATLKADANNPRTIDDEALAGLRVSLEAFGDLSGIVLNERTGELVAGHQRLRGLRDDGATEWVRVSKIEGYVLHPKTGERFPVRIVEWDEETQRLANLAANNPHLQGQFSDLAADQIRELDEAKNFNELQLGKLLDELGTDEAHLEGSLEDFDAVPNPRPTWIMVAAPEDIAAEVEAMLREKYHDEPGVRIEKSTSAR